MDKKCSYCDKDCLEGEDWGYVLSNHCGRTAIEDSILPNVDKFEDKEAIHKACLEKRDAEQGLKRGEDGRSYPIKDD